MKALVVGLASGGLLATILSAPLVRHCHGACDGQIPPPRVCIAIRICDTHSLVAWPWALLLAGVFGCVLFGAVTAAHRRRVGP